MKISIVIFMAMCYTVSMKYRSLWLLPAVVFPYYVLIAVRLMRAGRFGVLYENAAPPVIFSSLGVWGAGLLCAIVWTVLSWRAKESSRSMLRTVCKAFFLQVPAYLVFFQACYIFPFTIMTIPIKTFYLPICTLAFFPIVLCAVIALIARFRKTNDRPAGERPLV